MRPPRTNRGARGGPSTAETTTKLVSPNDDEVEGWRHYDGGDRFPADVRLTEASPADFDALLLPGGVAKPDQLRMNPQAVDSVRAFFDAGKPVAAICHGPWTLIEAQAVRGRTLTSWPSLRTDLENAGAHWVDEPVVADQGLVTSRNPEDIPAFSATVLEELAEGTNRARVETGTMGDVPASAH
ncbi:MAG: type 1 glutamine amidotransferase [Steroidobacteraceae bacterium]|nr:type 1 glutamine amidotransferase [Steroidobacteraceae bacterium]